MILTVPQNCPALLSCTCCSPRTRPALFPAASDFSPNPEAGEPVTGPLTPGQRKFVICSKSLQNRAVLEGRVHPTYPHGPRGIKASRTSCRHTVKTCSINENSKSTFWEPTRSHVGHNRSEKGFYLKGVYKPTKAKKKKLRYVHYLGNQQRLHFCEKHENANPGMAVPGSMHAGTEAFS